MSTHEKVIEKRVEAELAKLAPKTQVRVLSRLLKAAREEAKEPEKGDPRQLKFDEARVKALLEQSAAGAEDLHKDLRGVFNIFTDSKLDASTVDPPLWVTAPCPHGRPNWQRCPYCLGIACG